MSAQNEKRLTSFVLPEDLYEELRQYAFYHRSNMTAVVRDALRDWLKKERELDAMERACPNSGKTDNEA